MKSAKATPRQQSSLPLPEARPFDFDERLREIDMFFQGTARVHQTMNKVADLLEAAKVPYAIVGGMAVNAHKHERTTRDVDFLVTKNGFDTFVRLHVGEEFDRAPGRPRRFVDRNNGVTFDFLITGYFPGSGQPGPFAYPDPEEV